MSSWLDRWAKRAAEAPPTPLSDAEMSASPDVARPASSRRDFLKKAGIVGGVAWSVPVLQTVMAPAASAASNTPLGQPCNDLSTCANGTAYCSGTCCGGLGAVCGTALCAPGSLRSEPAVASARPATAPGDRCRPGCVLSAAMHEDCGAADCRLHVSTICAASQRVPAKWRQSGMHGRRKLRPHCSQAARATTAASAGDAAATDDLCRRHRPAPGTCQ